MSEHIYLQLDKIKGSCERAGHKEWIELLNFSHGLSYSTSPGKDFSGHVDHSAFSFNKVTDASSQGIIEKLNRREEIAVITLEIWKDKSGKDGGVELAIKIKLGKCRVSSYSMSGSDDGHLPSEQVSFVYQTIEWTFPGNKTTDHDFAKPHGNK
jgi:type VI secretion system Hcp family effector